MTSRNPSAIQTGARQADAATGASHLVLWDGVFARRAWGRYPPEELVRFVARTFGRVPDRKAVRFLEVGCGPGANLWFLRREGYAVAGIDGSPTAIRQATARLQAEGLWADPPGVDLREGNFATLPWPTASFDAVIDIEAIYANDLRTIRSALSEIHRLLKPGGSFFSKMFGPKTTGYGTGRRLEEHTFSELPVGPCANFGTTHFFTEEELRALLASFARLKLDWVHRKDHEGTVDVFEWLVTARK